MQMIPDPMTRGLVKRLSIEQMDYCGGEQVVITTYDGRQIRRDISLNCLDGIDRIKSLRFVVRGAVVDTLPYMDRRMREIEMARQATPPTGPNRHEVGQERPTHPLTDLTGF